MLRSHYPSVDLEQVVTSYARGTDAAKIAKLENEAEEPGKKLASDVDLFGEGGAVLHRLEITHVELLYKSNFC